LNRFDAIRDATERAERAIQAVRLSMDNVTAMAHEIATTASNQALEATNKLLSQSEYLQNMLDDIVAKISPAPPGQLSGGTPTSNPNLGSQSLGPPPPGQSPTKKL